VPRDEATSHQALSFDDLSASYNFRKTTDWVELFVRLVVDELRALDGPTAVVDIGCGSGIGGDLDRLRPIREAADTLWGVEPDEHAPVPPGVFDEIRRADLELAELPDGHFDLAYSFMVMEHVRDPADFLRRVRRTLKPGGTHLFITINGRHYFGRVARIARALRIDEHLLRLVRRAEDVDRYHYPVHYAFNTPDVIDRHARLAGFGPPEYVFVEQDGPIDYMRGPLKPFWRALQWKRHLVKRPESLLTMIVRMRAAA
jgi:SAM-dependent methyltransferase